MAKKYWLLKTEPEAFSWDDLEACPGQTTEWDGVRNYQARNLLRDEIKKGDGVLFYHSRIKPPAVIGVARVVQAGYPDATQFDPTSKYHDPGSKPDEPRWYLVDIQAQKRFARPVGLDELKATPGLEGMMVTRKGARLSVQPVTPEEWKIVLALGRRKSPADS